MNKFQELFEEIRQEGRPIPHRRLPALSNPSQEDLEAFGRTWPTLPVARRREVIQALLRLSEDNLDLNFCDVLLLCLEDEDEQVRTTAIEALDDDESFTLLEHLLRIVRGDPSAGVRGQALLSLARFAYIIETSDRLGDYRAPLLRLLLETFYNRQELLEVRRRAVEAMACFGGEPEVEEAIAVAYGEEAREMRGSAVRAMGLQMSARWYPLLEQELSNPDPALRYEAALACGEAADPCFVPHLAPLLQDADHEVACAAIWALGEIGGEQARRLLERCRQRPEADIREAAEEALQVLLFFEDPFRLADW